MGERAGLVAKAPEVKQSNSNSRVRRTERLQSMDTPVDRIMFLQRTAGNQAVQRLIKSGALQAKLRIGQPGDVYEQEADRVADAVMRMPEPGVQRQVEPEEEEEETLQAKPLTNQITYLVHVQRQEETEEEVQKQPEEEEEESVQAKGSRESSPIMSPAVESGINSIRGGEKPLSESSRAFFEPRFGADFSDVKVHTGANANHLTKSINAKAFTVGRDVVFGSGQYSPESSSGKQLLAHELTHVVQQKSNMLKKNRIQRWKGSGHSAITETVGKKIKFDPVLLSQLRHYCYFMDLRVRRLVRAGLDIFTKKPIFKIKPEGPDHGEGGMYTTTDKGKATRLNVARQKYYLGLAVAAKKKAQKVIKKVLKGSTSIRVFHKMAKLIYKNLGDALHVAQDRGAHGEGVKGFGHSQSKYDCDDPSQNIPGYNEALKNTKDVLTTFNRDIGATRWWQRSFRHLQPLQRHQRGQAMKTVSGRLISGRWIFNLRQVKLASLKKKEIANIAFITKKGNKKIAGYCDIKIKSSFQCNKPKTMIQFGVKLQNIRGYDSRGKKVHFYKIPKKLKLKGKEKFMNIFKELCP